MSSNDGTPIAPRAPRGVKPPLPERRWREVIWSGVGGLGTGLGVSLPPVRSIGEEGVLWELLDVIASGRMLDEFVILPRGECDAPGNVIVLFKVPGPGTAMGEERDPDPTGLLGTKGDDCIGY